MLLSFMRQVVGVAAIEGIEVVTTSLIAPGVGRGGRCIHGSVMEGRKRCGPQGAWRRAALADRLEGTRRDREEV